MILEKVKDGERFEEAYRRFKRECDKEQLFAEIRKHEYYEKPSARRKTIRTQSKRGR